MIKDGVEQYYPELRLSKKNRFVAIEQIGLHCLDKQRVKEAIMKWLPGGNMDHADSCVCPCCKIFEELKLE